MTVHWTQLLTRWIEAGLIDTETAARIRAFELEHAGSSRLHWPIMVALMFGALLLAGGVLLFVSAHWDALSPHARFALVIALVAAFHVAGALTTGRFPAMASALHTIGTVALGAGIFLAGQIFNLDEHWPGGVMLWALGATIAWVLLTDTPQMVLAAILTPAWLASEWIVATHDLPDLASARVLACGIFLLALAYFTPAGRGHLDAPRRALVWLGGISLLPAALFVAAISVRALGDVQSLPRTAAGLQAIGWIGALGVPLIVSAALRRSSAWPNVVAAFWVLALFGLHSATGSISLYAWWALGATALVAWGVREGRSERINMGAVIFAATVMAFYFSEVMDKLGRSLSLVGLGLLFLAGGWALERLRRNLIQHARGAA